MDQLPMSFTELAQFIVAVGRIQEFLLTEELLKKTENGY